MKNLVLLNCVKNIVLFLICPILTFYLLESFLHNPFETMKIKIQLYNMLFYIIFALFLFFIFGKTKIALPVETILFLVIGLANFYVYRFRSNPILPWDVYSLKTAVSVSDNYDYALSGNTIATIAGFIILVVVEIALTNGVFSIGTTSQTKLLTRIVGVLITCICLTVYTKALHMDTFVRKLGLYDKLFTADTMQFKDGTSIAFLMELKYLKIEKPEGYSEEAAEALLDEYSNNKESNHHSEVQNPNIIVIMNEAFSDPGILCDFKTNEDYMPFIHSILAGAENTVSGSLNVSVLGGNTANTEFEFLTGDSMAFLTQGSVAYQQYIHQEVATILDTFHQQDYECVSMHPYKPTGWNRDKVYEYMDFDKQLFLSDFKDATYLRTYVDDESCYKMIQKQFEDKEEGKPLFVFNVTMQNHSGYTKASENFTPEISIEGVDNLATIQYVSLMKKSDDAFRKLTEYFANQEEPTMIVMFGDHQASDSVVNPLLALSGKKCATMTTEEEYDRYKVPFVIWANYSIEEENNIETSANYLSGMVLEKAGLTLSPYQNFLKELSKEYPVVTGKRIMNEDGHSYEYSEVKDDLNNYAILEYYNLNHEANSYEMN